MSEKFFALCEVFGSARVGMMTGDASVNGEAEIICCTAEVLANLALRAGADADIGLVVMDEFHYYGDADRGWAWQVPLLELPRAQFLLMSATLGPVDFFVGRPDPPHRPPDRGGDLGRPSGAAVPLLRHHPAARDRRRAAAAPGSSRSTSCTSPRPPPWNRPRR